MFNHPDASGSLSNSGVPMARAALDSMKVEIAKELGINLMQGQKGDLPSRVAGQMVKRMIEQQERAMSVKER